MSDAYPMWGYRDLLHVIRLGNEYQLDLMIRPNADLTAASVLLDCSDLFHWALADAEPIGPDDLPELRRAIDDLAAVGEKSYVGDLFCCRRNQMRPQGPWYGYCDSDGKVRRRFVPIAVEALFDACGPERTDAPKLPRPADGRRWEYGGAVEPADFAAMFQPGGKFGP